MASNKEIALHYLKFLQNSDLQSIQKLFTKDAIVRSPIYGSLNAHKFYETLLKDTSTSVLEIKGIFEEIGANRLSLYFSYTWTLVNKERVTFDVVDIITLNTNSQITELQIIYDASKSRGLVEELKNGPHNIQN